MSVSVEVEDVSVDDEYVREEYARRQLGSGRHELEMLVHKTHEANQALLSTGVFKHLHTSVLPGSDQHKVRLVVHAQHKKWYGLHAGVEHNGADAFTVILSILLMTLTMLLRESRQSSTISLESARHGNSTSRPVCKEAKREGLLSTYPEEYSTNHARSISPRILSTTKIRARTLKIQEESDSLCQLMTTGNQKSD
jgi:hypothetical protein